MHPEIAIKIAEMEERLRILSLEVADLEKKKAEVNQLQKILDLVRPKNAAVEENLLGFGIFPDLVWQKISYEVRDTQDWLNLHSASSKLMGLLEKDKFGRIFPLIFGLVSKYLKRKDVINLCGTSRKIASCIISQAQTRHLHSHWARFVYEPKFYYDHDIYYDMVTVDTYDKVQVIKKELLRGGSDFPIPFGINFQDWRRGEYMTRFRNWRVEEYWQEVKTFLDQFGTRIWFCDLSFSSDGIPDPGQFPNMLSQCLSQIPNVIRLALHFREEVPNHPNPPIFPHLAKLNILSLVQATHKGFHDFLRHHADQLVSLSIVGEHAPEEAFRYSNLKVLRLESDWLSRIPLRLRPFADAPVTKLWTDFHVDDFAGFGHMFLQFNKFGKSLESLDLMVRFPNNYNYNNEENDMTWIVHIHLPKLKSLAIHNYQGGLGFLLQIPSLEELTLNCRFANDGSINLDWRRPNEICKSDIWPTFSNLQTVTVSRQRTKRTDYNEYLRRNMD